MTEHLGSNSGFIRSLLIASTAALSVFVAGCGASESASVDEATTRACHLLAKAEDDMAMSVYLWVQNGKPSAGSQTIRDAIGNYPVLISKGADEALSAPADLSASFQEAAKNSKLYKQAMDAKDSKSAGVFTWAIGTTVEKCKTAGVEMLIHDQTTGQLV